MFFKRKGFLKRKGSFWHKDFKISSLGWGSENAMSVEDYRGSSKEVEIPSALKKNPVTTIGRGAFEKKEIESVVLHSDLQVIKDGAFMNNNLTEITIPDSVYQIGFNAFDRNNLIKVTLPENVELIKDEAFGRYTDQILQDYEKNNKKATTYQWNEKKQEWQNQLKYLLEKQNKNNIDNLLDNKENLSERTFTL